MQCARECSATELIGRKNTHREGVRIAFCTQSKHSRRSDRLREVPRFSRRAHGRRCAHLAGKHIVHLRHRRGAPTAQSGKKPAPKQAKWGNSPEALWALDNVSLKVRKGEFLGIAGHTGSGKSTLIQHMNGILHPTSGRVVAFGSDIAEKGAANDVRGALAWCSNTRKTSFSRQPCQKTSPSGRATWGFRKRRSPSGSSGPCAP